MSILTIPKSEPFSSIFEQMLSLYQCMKQLRLLVITLFVLCPYFYIRLYEMQFMLYFWLYWFATAR